MTTNVKLPQLQTFRLSGSGAAAGSSTLNLVSFTGIDGTSLVMSTHFGTKAWGTIEPGTTREEAISFTGITQNPDGSATLTGVKNVDFLPPNTETANIQTAHAGGVKFIISNNPGMLNNAAFTDNDETILQPWTFEQSAAIPRADATHNYTVPAGQELYFITKEYADGLTFAGTSDATTTQKGIAEEATQTEVNDGTAVGGTGARLFINPSTLSGGIENELGENPDYVTGAVGITAEAGEAITAGEAIYISGSDGKAYLTDASSSGEEVSRYVGIALDTVAITEDVRIATSGKVEGMTFGDPTTVIAETVDLNLTGTGTNLSFSGGGTGGGVTQFEQVFISGSVRNMSKLDIRLKNNGNPPASLRVRLETVDTTTGRASGSALISRDFTAGDLSGSYASYDVFNGAPAIDIEPNTQYAILIQPQGGGYTAGNTYHVDSSNAALSNGQYYNWAYSGGGGYYTALATNNKINVQTYTTLQHNYYYGDSTFLGDTPGELVPNGGSIRKKAGYVINSTDMTVDKSIGKDRLVKNGIRKETSGTLAPLTTNFYFPIPYNAEEVVVQTGTGLLNQEGQDILRYSLNRGQGSVTYTGDDNGQAYGISLSTSGNLLVINPQQLGMPSFTATFFR